MDKQFFVVANWKANKTILETSDWVKKFSGEAVGDSYLEVIIAAPFMALDTLKTHITDYGLTRYVSVASQDISMFPVGAYTGEVPGEILENLVTYCLIGHSERRRYLGETTEMAGKKAEWAMENDITPIICAQTLEEIPENINRHSVEKYLIMYEPFEAISTDNQYRPESSQKINEVLVQWQKKLPTGARLLYGGSVNQENITDLMMVDRELLSGFVVGRASLEADSFSSIIRALATSRN